MTSKFKDYYDILKVPRAANEGEIKLAYRRLAREHHPDLHAEKEKDVHTQRMQEVNEAYQVLSSKESRAKYDQFGENWKEGSPPRQERKSGAQTGGEEEAFSEFFRNAFRQGERSEASNDAFPSELDIEASIDLALRDAVHGTEKSFTLMTTGLCQNCRGTGRKEKSLCPVCGGVGEIRRQREVKAKIPRGLKEGDRIRLKGQGNEGRHGRGDLYLSIHLSLDPGFKVDGINLEMKARVMPWAAALGSEISVETLDGQVRMRLPRATHTGTRLRLPGKGLGKTDERGDLFVRVEIDIPSSLTPKAEGLLKQWEDESHG